ncbi:hypothetical protein [Streptomyces sp. SID13031]|uniref:hypothetical protein n=1 Tax=Streptomyces sp. SID13031 TaxID=2706046 RepID=UPI0013CA0CFA|nr:hypothetical protein [Streptomyces sp. SID13031]NEA36989.1 hypothetical protein [Streptomyces sp. SID13031]
MTHVDDRKGPTRAKRSAGRPANRANARALNHGGDSRVTARAGRAVPTKDIAASQFERELDSAERLAAGKRAAPRQKAVRSRTAVVAVIVAGAAIVATFAYILTNGSSPAPQAGGNPPPVLAPQTTAPPTTDAGANPAPAAVNTVKADRKPPVAPQTTAGRTSATPNTGPASPVFRRGQWISVVDTYSTDAGMNADQLAKGLAGKLIAAGIPARAMMLDGQYPGIANSTLQPQSDAWVVYLAPLSTAEAALKLCQAPKTQAAHSNLACPTYEPAAKAG